MMKKHKGFTLVELVTTIALLGILSGAFVSLFLPQMMLYFFLPNELRVQIAATDAMAVMTEGDRFARGLRYAEPDTISRETFLAPGVYEFLNFTGPVLYADATRLRYGYHDLNRNFHTVELALDAGNNTLTRSIDGAAAAVISNGGAPGTGGIQIATGTVNGDGVAAIFRYYKMEKYQNLNVDNVRGGAGPEITGYTDSVIPAEDLYKIIRVDIAFRVNTGGAQVISGQSEILKQSGVKLRNFIFPDSGEWEFSFVQWPGDSIPDLLAVKKNADNLYVRVTSGTDYYNTYSTLMTPVTVPLAERGDNYAYLMADCAPTATGAPDGTPDLVEIKKNMTNTTAQMELRIYNGTDLANATLLRPPITLPIANLNGYEQYDFQMANYNTDGRPDLFIIAKGRNGATVAANYFTVYAYSGADYTTSISGLTGLVKTPSLAINNNWRFFVADYDSTAGVTSAGKLDLVALRIKGAASVTTYVWTTSVLTSPFATLSVNGVASSWTPSTYSNMEFGAGDFDQDGHMDLLRLQRNKTDSGSMDAQALSKYDPVGVQTTGFTNEILGGGSGAADWYQVSDGKSVQ